MAVAAAAVAAAEVPEVSAAVAAAVVVAAAVAAVVAAAVVAGMAPVCPESLSGLSRCPWSEHRDLQLGQAPKCRL